MKVDCNLANEYFNHRNEFEIATDVAASISKSKTKFIDRSSNNVNKPKTHL